MEWGGVIVYPQLTDKEWENQEIISMSKGNHNEQGTLIKITLLC